MGPSQRVFVTLDRPDHPYEIRWTDRAEARNASLPRPVDFADIGKPKRRLFAICAIIWAALVERDHNFESPEDLAKFVKEEEKHLAAIQAIGSMLREALAEKKSPPKNASSIAGPPTSSNSDSPSASTPGT